jgi:MinD superfamily P-loop ATPase
MKIAVSSGKGGTGKTTVATNLAVSASRAGYTTAYLDCDVEEPNGALFLRPEVTREKPVLVSVPGVDRAKCTGCGQCGQICQYSAIVAMEKDVLLFPELCHGCGGCWTICPAGALFESHRRTGVLEIGAAGDVQCLTGRLDVGEAMSPPVIRAVKEEMPEVQRVFLDAPPGTSCPVIESIRGADFVLLVTEPTPFGLSDLKLAVDMVRAVGLDFAVVINRAGLGDEATEAYCDREQIEILARIPDDRKVAQAYSRGEIACDVFDSYARLYAGLLEQLSRRAPEHLPAGKDGKADVR